MKKIIAFILFIQIGFGANFMTIPYNFVSKQIISASKIMANYNALRNAIVDGSKKINIAELWINGTRVFDSNKDITAVDGDFSGDLTADTISANTLTLGDVTANNMYVEDLVVATADFTYLEATNATIETLVVSNDIAELTVTDFTATTINASKINLSGMQRCLVYTSAAFSIPNGVSTPITFNAEAYDDGDMHVAGSSTINITQSGMYSIVAQANIASNTTGYRILELDFVGHSASVVAEGYSSQDPVTGSATIMQVSSTVYLTVGGTIQLLAFQNSGGALDAGITGGRNFISVTRMY